MTLVNTCIFLQDVILDIISTVWFLPYLEYLEVDGIVQHVNHLVSSVTILLKDQGKAIEEICF